MPISKNKRPKLTPKPNLVQRNEKKIEKPGPSEKNMNPDIAESLIEIIKKIRKENEELKMDLKCLRGNQEQASAAPSRVKEQARKIEEAQTSKLPLLNRFEPLTEENLNSPDNLNTDKKLAERATDTTRTKTNQVQQHKVWKTNTNSQVTTHATNEKQATTAMPVSKSTVNYVKTTNIPPINIISNNPTQLIQFIKSDLEIQNFHLKKLNENKFAIYTDNTINFHKIKKFCLEKNFKFYTFTPKDEKNQTFVLKGLHSSCETSEILEELKKLESDNLKIKSPEFTNSFYNHNGAKRSYCPANAHINNQPVNRKNTSLILRQLRSEMVRLSSVQGPPLNGYIVTSDDEHQSETVDPRDMRREFLTGFYGSAGNALVTIDKAVLWTDGRYHLQADLELDCDWILMKKGQEPVPSITEWLKHEFKGRPNVRIGADPTLVPAATWEAWEIDLANSSISLVAVHNNLIDLIWQVGRPNYNSYIAYPLKDEYAGKPWQEKVKEIRLEMSLVKADALVITALDEIAWLFNIRGYDLPHTPVLRSYAIVTHRSLHLYTPKHKLSRSVDVHLKMDSCFHADCVKWHNYTSIWYDLKTMSQAWNKVWLPAPCGYAEGASKAIYSSIPFEKQLPKASPIIDLRAVKNKIEAEGMRKAHIRDAVAMCDFLAYMEEQIELDSQGWDELQVARVANEFRYEQDFNKGISFPTIAAYGAHAALPHYEPTNLTNIPLGKSSTLVVDSGGQYLDGTTDITRTLHFGEPTEEQKEAYTRVLIGSIQLSSLIFPEDLMSDQLDVLARRSLWSTGNDYMHGTGHGIGHFSSVHESPISISYTDGMSVTLKPGFFLSNEPGFYKEDDFGVRLENILEVVVAGKSRTGQTFLKFRDVTLVPYEPKLIDFNMLTPLHRRWLNNYNQRIREEVGGELKKHLRMKGFYWMMKKTNSIPEWCTVDEDVFLGHSHSSPSTFKEIHGLVAIIFIYNIMYNFLMIYS
ncbi:hypothetical protein KPH14_010942 [Odynerus spinipes]|uniref:Uncharacterized protein n=1 Tax=Odynerus spinipes TaxID=1348599 RepID=A0AAD9VU01_9HYME|nr:hypothetical protein KPH14_010942 [Odynerus spinipes]